MRASRRPGLRAAALSLGTIAVTSLLARPAQAHKVGLSRGDYTLEGEVLRAEMVFARGELAGAAPEADLDHDGTLSDTEALKSSAAVQKHVVDEVIVEGDGARCEGRVTEVKAVESDGLLVQARYQCPSVPRVLSLRLDVFDELSNGHRQIGVIHAGGTTQDIVAFSTHRSFAVPVSAGVPGSAPSLEQPREPSSLGSLFVMGIEHILTGYDHLVFLLGLILVGGRPRSLIGVITAFTVAHSISLAVAVLGVWTPSPRIVEPAIALSIAYVGFENFFVKDAAKRWRITFPFGLIHGFGFASALQEIALPRAKIPAALLLFNLGVETGQLLVLALVLPLVLWARKQPWFLRHGVRGLSAAIVVAGLVWFVSRVLSPA